MTARKDSWGVRAVPPLKSERVEPGPARELHPRGLHGRSDLDRDADANATLAGLFRRAFISEIRCATTTSRPVRFIPKVDSRERMNAEGPKCANTPTPARQPVRRRSDVLDSTCFQRTARKPWICQCPGNGHENCTHADCRQTIAPGDRYVEYVGEAAMYESGHRYCQPCGEASWTT